MHARAAYIRSLGTTSILVAAALLMLTMVGALVGFHRWPGGTVGGTVQSVPLQPPPQPLLSAVRTVRRTVVVRSASTTGRRISAAGLVKVVRVRAPRPVGDPVALTPGHTGPGAPAQQPTAAQHSLPEQPPTTPPADPQQIESLVNQAVGSLPAPPSEAGGQLEVTVPIVGVTVSAPGSATAQ